VIAMASSNSKGCSNQQGIVLITTLLLLIVITILVLAMFQGVGLDNIIAGNTLDKQRAVQGADGAQRYAEIWLLAQMNANGSVTPQACPAPETGPVVCSMILSQAIGSNNVSNVPWTANGMQYGFTYNPGNGYTVSTSGGSNTLYGYPVAYIGYDGPDAVYSGAYDYVVDAWAYGTSPTTAAVVESVYRIRYLSQSASLP